MTAATGERRAAAVFAAMDFDPTDGMTTEAYGLTGYWPEVGEPVMNVDMAMALYWPALGPCQVCEGRDLGTTDGPDGEQWPRVCGACTPPTCAHICHQGNAQGRCVDCGEHP